MQAISSQAQAERRLCRAGHKVNNDKGSIYMVFDYMEHDMTGLLQRVSMSNRNFKPHEVGGNGEGMGQGWRGGAVRCMQLAEV